MKRFSTVAACDLRSLCAFRVAIAVAALCHFAGAPNVLISANAWSLYSISDHEVFHTVLVCLTYFALACLALGYRTWLASLCSWFLLGTYHAAMGFLYSDPVLLSLLLLGAFLPLNIYFSVDAAMDRGYTPDEVLEKPVKHVGSVQLFTRSALTVSVSVLFVSSSVVLTSPVISSLLGLIAVLTILAIAPVRTLALLFAAVWLIASKAALSQNISTMTAISVLIALLPGWVWQRISELDIFTARHQIRIYFDQPCGFCRKICYLFCSFMLLGNAKIAPAQSEPDALHLLKTYDSWVVYDFNGQYYLHWHAVLLLLKRSPLWWPLGYLLEAINMGHWGKPLYRVIGSSRTVFSKITALVIPYRRLRRVPSAIDFLAASFWLLILALGPVLMNRISPDMTAIVLHYLGTLHAWVLW